MARPGKYLSIFIPEELLSKIEETRYREQIPTRVEAIRMLLARALDRKAKKTNA